ncbi:acVLRF1 family peptidyl-tRNA hydrolase [Actinopolymorpha alba]|uniref:acVLRF1 family peptidyl-tRNA hydrolase n=1 Tax=Actinopolymorpha alba TaxID=533267 RepID=UPI00037D5C5D|nr:acVLRF1 family peptidyl-tRNA hydrolase [Actinopolymorpha alba]
MPSASTSDASPASKQLTLAPERLERWLNTFLQRHGGPAAADDAGGYVAGADVVTVTAGDGSRADFEVPFPPLTVNPALPYGGLLAHATRDRCVGVVLVRLGGYAAGVFEGRRLVASKVGSRLVQGRSAAGGWSQQRFARRREKQAREAFGAAAEVVARILLPRAPSLDAVVLGGDRRGVTRVMEDARFAALRSLVSGPHLTVPDPRLAVLERTPEQFRAVRVRLAET